MIIAIAMLFQAVAPPPQPVSYPHLIPAPQTEQVTTGQCGTQKVVVRTTMQTGTPERGWHQKIEVSIANIRAPEADELRLDRALAAFGVVSSVGIYCLDGRAAQLSFNGPVTGLSSDKVMTVNIDGAHILDIR